MSELTLIYDELPTWIQKDFEYLKGLMRKKEMIDSKRIQEEVIREQLKAGEITEEEANEIAQIAMVSTDFGYPGILSAACIATDEDTAVQAVMKLKDGTLITASHFITDIPGWIRVRGIDRTLSGILPAFLDPDAGLDVNVNDIVWVGWLLKRNEEDTKDSA